MSFCNKCGKELLADDKFCSGCGNPVAAPVGGPTVAAPNTAVGGVKIVDAPDANPLFRGKCEYCLCVFEYHTSDLGYRAWYPHGFVYCPKCMKPNRHRLENRVTE